MFITTPSSLFCKPADATIRPCSLPPVRACLFDMDGLLLDTEDIANKVNNTLLAEYNRPPLPWSLKAQYQGRPSREAMDIFHAWARLPISRQVFEQKQRHLQNQLFPTAKPLPGVPMLLKTLKNSKVQIALATSSQSRTFRLKTIKHEHLFKAFEPHKRVLGDDERIPRGRGKPCPDIYLLALETINAELRAKGEREIRPSECLVFEDSVPGVEAGRRAGMRVIWCPHEMLLQEYEGREEEVLAGIAGARDEERMRPGTARERLLDPPGTLGDGYAEYYSSLADFDPERYGIRRKSF